jgi:hypothetical protein
MLSALRVALASASISYSSLVSAATSSAITVPVGLGSALATAYASTTTGASSSGGNTAGNSTGSTSAGLPSLDTSKCATPITGVGFANCAAGAVGDFSVTLTNSVSKTSCNLVIASGIFTLSNGTSTVVIHMNGELPDLINYFNGALTSIGVVDTASGQLSQIAVGFTAGKLSSATATGAQGAFACLNI